MVTLFGYRYLYTLLLENAIFGHFCFLRSQPSTRTPSEMPLKCPRIDFLPLGGYITPDPRNALRGALKCEIEFLLSPKDLKSLFLAILGSNDWTIGHFGQIGQAQKSHIHKILYNITNYI